MRFRSAAASITFAALFSMAWVSPAFADPASLAAAQSLFEEGRKLVAKQDYAAAATRFEESQKLDPGAGTLLQLARCYENLGRTASAWGTYHEASNMADQAGRKDWVTLANGRAAALEPKLSRLTLVVTEQPPGLVVTRDGVVVPASVLASAVPVDPGTRHVEATATGRIAFTTDVVVSGPGSFTATIPKLDVAPTPPPAPAASAASTPATDSNATKTAPASAGGRNVGPILLLGLGGAAVVTGVVFGLVAMSANSTSKEKCPNPRCADQDGVDANDRAKTMGTLSTVFVGAGAAVAAGGAVWLLLGKPSSRTAIVPAVSPQSVALGFRGTFQ